MVLCIVDETTTPQATYTSTQSYGSDFYPLFFILSRFFLFLFSVSCPTVMTTLNPKTTATTMLKEPGL